MALYQGSMRLARPATAVIYDMDGVLLNTEGFYTEVTQAIVQRFGKVYDWSIKRHMVGRPAIVSARILVERLELPISPEEYLTEREHALASLFPRAEAMPGAREITQEVRARGAPQAVASSSSRRLFDLKTTLHRTWFADFDVIVLGDDPRVNAGKPSPDIFLVAARELGVVPDECVVIEDAPAGVAAARAAGMQVVGVPDPGMDPAGLAEADLIVASLTELRAEDLLGKRL